MTESPSSAYIVRVRRPDLRSLRDEQILFYAVLTDSPHSALEAVDAAEKDDVELSFTGSRLTCDTVRAIGLLPGEPRLL